MQRLLYTIFTCAFFLLFHQAWSQDCVDPNPQSHLILIPANVPNLDGEPLPIGATIVALYQVSANNYRCAGSLVWEGKSSILQVYGSSPDGDEGYAEGEFFAYRVILPSGCVVERAAITVDYSAPASKANRFTNFGQSTLSVFNLSTPNLDFTIPNDRLITCNVTQVVLEPVGKLEGASFQWFDSTKVISSSKQLNVTKAGLYKLTASNQGCSSSQEVIVRSDLIAPILNLGPTDTLPGCQGEKLTLFFPLQTDSLISVRWNTGASTPEIEVQQSGLYTINAEGRNGCKSVDSIFAYFYPRPNIGFQDTLRACIGKTTELNLASEGRFFTWSTGSTEAKTKVEKAGLLSVSVINRFGCAAADSTWVKLAPGPVLSLQDTLRICEGVPTRIRVSSTAPSFLWSNGSSEKEPTVNKVGTYTVTVSDQAGCQTKDSIRLVLKPNFTVNLPPRDTICPGENLAIDARSSGQQFSWSTGATTGLITVNRAGQYRVTVTDSEGCKGQGITQVASLSVPTAMINKPKDFLCLGDSMTLSGTGGSPLKWLDPSNTSQRIANDRIRIKPQAKATYGFVAENFCGTDTAFVQIEVRKVNGSAGKDTAILLGRKLQLQARGGKSYQWTSPEYKLGSPNVANPEVSPEDSTYFVVTIEDENKCVLKDTVFVGVYSDVKELIKPINLFTPNGDGKNDVLKFNDLNLFISNKIKVFNRWGGVVFQQSNYQNDWDGTYNGRPLPAGVYYYVLELDEAVLKSSLTIIRN